ncbi:hypothetical protein FQZ97_1050490 [compost metagenome]
MEFGEIVLDRNAGFARPRPVAPQPAGDTLFGPTEEGVLEQAGDVIGHRAVDRVLEIQHPGIRRAEHQVARHVVAVHQHLGLPQRTVDQQPADPLPGRLLRIVQLDAEVTLHIPLGK